MMTRLRVPKIGLRVYKTCFSALIVALIYQYLLNGRNPCFACIGAVYGLGSQFKEGFTNGFNRFVGTLLGGLMVIPFYWLYVNTPLGIPAAVYMVLGLFCVMALNLAFGATSAIQPGTVVYFVVMFTQPETGYVGYTIARIIDTAVGVAASLLLTALLPSKLDRENGISIKAAFSNWANQEKGHSAKHGKSRE